MQLREAFILTIAIAPPTNIGSGPWGPRSFVGARSGTIRGTQLNGQILPGHGGDWLTQSADGFAHPDIRHILRTDDDATVYVRGFGLMQMNAAASQAINGGAATKFEDHYVRVLFTFETGDPRYQWLNQTVFLGEGRFPTGSTVEYRVFEVA
jgi:hypothetical protein